ncbi:2-dehydropantoate 2-reductase N-terminal domain-containing protein [Undibacterium sp. RTI2.1]|uniref:ketopantoate reductase family protein n=1 Tax=unclassified Undibacterium TaxID=2630295 RepID=UPI002B22DD42|nr:MULTISPECIES: 2-dehydropantoate 2-reductase N-terminal domain-containing protein [unclassified Undibacterium]MEB0031432.1 2-dehydropantoate 2-reductase N-terminal domain-containing protein [Undibacterium sp. RTI2.1]MEB0117736.1 2-dehydropantoate 2-reductase N-terminal domain-containing protein [Undibacterium sp. RTI2.2]
MNAPQLLRIAVLGAGNIGSAFAFHLAKNGGHDVTVIARPGSARYQQLLRDKGIIDVHDDRASVIVAERLNEEIQYDVVVVTLLAHQLDAVLPAMLKSKAKSFLFLFNNFDPESIQDMFGTDRCTFGMPFIQSFLDRDGKVNATIGAGGQKTKLGKQTWVDVFNTAGLPTSLEPNMSLWLRCHAPICIAFESSSFAGMKRGGGATWAESMTIAHGIHECYRLIKGLGYNIYPSAKVRINQCPAWLIACMLWVLTRVKSFRELLALGALECSAMIDLLVAAAPLSDNPIAIEKIKAMRPVGIVN